VHQPITPSARTKGQSRAGAYGNFIHEIDFSVGQVLRSLNELGLAGNTLVIFTSDNGGEILSQPEKPEAKARAAGLLANGSLRGDKHTLWKGGVSVPYLVRWPGKVPAGQTSDAMISILDTFAIVAHLLDRSAPNPAKAAPDSVTFRDALLRPQGNAGSERRSMIVTNHDGIVAKRKQNDVQAKKALYHLGRNPGEQADVLASEPAIAAELEAELAKIRRASTSHEALR
jgi:arylsulfatase A-like enzyme